MQKPPNPIFKSRESDDAIFALLIESAPPDWLAKILASRLDKPINVELLHSNDLFGVQDP